MQIVKSQTDTVLGLGEELYMLVDTASKQQIAYLAKRHGEWFIHFPNPIMARSITDVQKALQMFMGDYWQ